MNTASTPRSEWSHLSKLLHWLIALMILGMGTVGITMVNMSNSPTKITVFALHKSMGITLLALIILRLVWRLYAGAPAPVPGTSPLMRYAAAAMHAALYVLLFAIPLSGWLLNSAAGFPLQWFGMVNLPAIAAQNDALHDSATRAHMMLFFGLLALVILHASAAIYHHMFIGDSTLSRMLPRGWLPVEPVESSESTDA